jgi:Peptidase_C39 like family
MDLDFFIPEGVPDLPEVDPTEIDLVAGEGHLLDQWWQDQQVDGLCAPTSAAIVTSAITGELHPKDEVAAVAERLGLIERMADGTYSGMDAHGIERLLEYYNVDADVERGSMDELRHLLGSGSQAIVAVDSDEIWYGPDDGDPNDRFADHALVVAGIDEARGTVILADPGDPVGGRGHEMTIAEFQNAWADSGYEMVVAEPCDPAPAAQPEPAAATRQAHRGESGGGPAPVLQVASAVIVPLVVGAGVIKKIVLKRKRGGAR